MTFLIRYALLLKRATKKIQTANKFYELCSTSVVRLKVVGISQAYVSLNSHFTVMQILSVTFRNEGTRALLCSRLRERHTDRAVSAIGMALELEGMYRPL